MNIVFSYDCEGHWGCVDWENPPLHSFKSEELHNCYKTLLDLHLKHNIPATFAFVGLYGLPPEQREDFVKDNLQDLHQRLPNLFSSGGLWDGHENLNLIAEAAKKTDLIEVGSHSLTHAPIITLNEAQQKREFALSKELLDNITGLNTKSYIYARNLFRDGPACLDTYSEFRDTPAVKTSQRLIDIIRTVSGTDLLKSNCMSDFIFWKGGHRRHFSDRGWKKLWLKRMKAARNNKTSSRTIHVWSHPHNLLTDTHVTDRMVWLMKLFDENRQYLTFTTMTNMTAKSKLKNV